MHACGFDSIPHDLGAYYTVQQLPADAPITLRGVVRSGGMASGGTIHSALGQFSRARQMKAAHSARRRAEGKPADGRSLARRVRQAAPRLRARLLAAARCRPSTRSSWPAAARPWRRTARSSATRTTPAPRRCGTPPAAPSSSARSAAAAQVGPVRNFLLGKVAAGRGPDEAKRDKSWFTVDFVGEGGGRTVHTRVSGGDPGYTETSMMLAESALCLALDDNPPTAGQVTTAAGDGRQPAGPRAGRGPDRFETL